MAWVAFDHAAHELEARAFNEPGDRWRTIADEIHAEVCERGFDRERLLGGCCCIGFDDPHSKVIAIPESGLLTLTLTLKELRALDEATHRPAVK
jgi:GH15 family glucan-1,4-alpha-glucosidase